MAPWGYSAALVLAVLLAVAALAKLQDRQATSASLAALGVPSPSSAARVIPLPELAAVVLLVLVPLAGATVVLGMLALFTTFLVSRIRSGVEAPCACFGASSNRPISMWSVARNGVLAVLAGLAVTALRPVWPGLLPIFVVAAGTALALLAIRAAETTPTRRGADR